MCISQRKTCNLENSLAYAASICPRVVCQTRKAILLQHRKGYNLSETATLQWMCWRRGWRWQLLGNEDELDAFTSSPASLDFVMCKTAHGPERLKRWFYQAYTVGYCYKAQTRLDFVLSSSIHRVVHSMVLRKHCGFCLFVFQFIMANNAQEFKIMKSWINTLPSPIYKTLWLNLLKSLKQPLCFTWLN